MTTKGKGYSRPGKPIGGASGLKFSVQCASTARELKDGVRELVECALQEKQSHKDIAIAVKRFLEKRHGPHTWHAVVAKKDLEMRLRFTKAALVILTGPLQLVAFRSAPVVEAHPPSVHADRLLEGVPEAARLAAAKRAKVMTVTTQPEEKGEKGENFARACLVHAVALAQREHAGKAAARDGKLNGKPGSDDSAASAEGSGGGGDDGGDGGAAAAAEAAAAFNAVEHTARTPFDAGAVLDKMRAALTAEYGAGWHGFAAKEEHALGSAVSAEGGAVYDLVYRSHRFVIWRHSEMLSIFPTLDGSMRTSLVLYALTVVCFLLYMGSSSSCTRLRARYGVKGDVAAAEAAPAEPTDGLSGAAAEVKVAASTAQQEEVATCEWTTSMLLFGTIALAMLSATKRFFAKMRKRKDYRTALRTSVGGSVAKPKVFGVHPSVATVDATVGAKKKA